MISLSIIKSERAAPWQIYSLSTEWFPLMPLSVFSIRDRRPSHLSNAIIPPTRRPCIEDSLTSGDNQFLIVTTNLMLHRSLLCYFHFETGKLRKMLIYMCTLSINNKKRIQWNAMQWQIAYQLIFKVQWCMKVLVTFRGCNKHDKKLHHPAEPRGVPMYSSHKQKAISE